jgi:hypothetical protein
VVVYLHILYREVLSLIGSMTISVCEIFFSQLYSCVQIYVDNVV